MRSAAKKEKEKSCYKLERKCSFVAVSSSTLVPYFSEIEIFVQELSWRETSGLGSGSLWVTL